MKSLAMGLGLVAAMAGTALFCTRPGDTRSVGPAPVANMPAERPEFSRDESAALFVGVRTFRHDDALTVPYAVDDAVDLAYRFALDQRVGLVPPPRVVLALSGSPQKEESKQRLKALRDAGVRVGNATAGDILNLLREQVAKTGRRGLLVLAVATHGFQQDGDAYLLGSTSAFGSPDTSVRTATLLDVAAEVPRSLIFIDACRDRIGQTSRGAGPDPAAAAPHVKGLARVRGQVVFYAAAPGQYAYDDEVHRNGVFTKALLDGLACEASAPRGAVLVETLHAYVDREVRRWIQKNRKLTVNPATQISMEGETRKMTLSECWRSPGPLIRVSFGDSVIAAYSEGGKPLWRRDLSQPIAAARAADLDADAFYEVVAGLRDQLVVLDRDGKPRWTRTGDGARLRAFTTGDLFRKKSGHVVAVWYDERSATSRLTILDRDGKEHSTFEYPGELRHVAVGRPTNLHAPRIVAVTRDSVFVLNPRKLEDDRPLWHRRTAGGTIRELRIADVNHDSRRDIVVTTAGGTSWFTFDGEILRPGTRASRKDVALRREAVPAGSSRRAGEAHLPPR